MFNDGESTVTLKDVLIGEVWVCAGQSNMEMNMKGYKGQPRNFSRWSSPGTETVSYRTIRARAASLWAG